MAPPAAPALTAVLLTKEEEDNIAAAISSLAGAVDRVLLIDAESTDRTVARAHTAAAAAALPCTVLLRPWRHDFAAQRNHAFDEVTDGWLLFVDADERLRDGHAERLRQAVSELEARSTDRDLVLSPRIIDATGGGTYDRTRRILRADTRLRFRGRIHEQPFHSDGSAPDSVELDVELIHHGYHPDAIAARRKRDRDGALIERCRQAEPDNPTWAFYAAREILAGGITDRTVVTRAYVDLRTAVSRYAETDLTDYERQREQEAYGLLAELALRSGDRTRVDEALATLRRDGRTAEAAYYGTLVESGLLLARLSGLVDGLDQAALATGPARPRLAGRYAELRALLALASGRYDEVADSYRGAVRCGAGAEVRSTFAALSDVLEEVDEPPLTSRSPAPSPAPPPPVPAPESSNRTS
ncbi:glycosyltransferase [Streptomyces sp. GESEQ-35]|uniref:glycosyltransferase n=1 Tax=Streptomyces sp. GESEQ-35 TaxID=2812657 RepID=UPI001B32B2C6|nr:glycosyltransferase [Streptomyces sp. GESEQ-35]